MSLIVFGDVSERVYEVKWVWQNIFEPSIILYRSLRMDAVIICIPSALDSLSMNIDNWAQSHCDG